MTPLRSVPKQDTVKIVLPLPPNRANARGHWRKIEKEKKAYYGAAFYALLLEPNPREQPRGARAVATDYFTVTASLFVNNLFDDDNAVALLKWPLDVLVQNGVLWSDKRPWCALSGIPEQVIDRKSPRVEITLGRSPSCGTGA